MSLRAYPPVSGRQQDADRLVYSEADLRRVLGLLLQGQPVSTIRLGANIVLTAPIVLDGVYDVVIDGGGRFGFSGEVDCCFSIGTADVEGIDFRGVTFTNTSGMNRIIQATDATATLRRVSFRDCYCDFVSKLYEASSGNPTWENSTVEGVTFLDQRGISLITASIGAAVFTHCYLARCYGVDSAGASTSVRATNDAASAGNIWLDVLPLNALTSDVFLSADAANENLLARPLAIGAYPTVLVDYSHALVRNSATHIEVQANVATTDATVTTLLQFTPNPSRCYLLEARITGRRTNGADQGAVYVVRAKAKVTSVGTVTISGTAADFTVEDDATWDATIDTSAGNIRLRVTGAAGQNITWTAHLTLDEV